MQRSLWWAGLLAVVLLSTTAQAYDVNANAKADVQQALTTAQKSKKPVLLVFGADWCPDCRALDKALKTGKNAKLIAKSFQLVKIDVGNFDHNVDLSDRYGSPIKKGIPAAVILSPDNQVLYTTKAGELANARKMSDDGIYEFFKQAANQVTTLKK
ncbi:thioredoxin family protein [Aquirhabdus parva]|uniref:Thioredoxin family protein n=1 Tax=Aquirhabdus parva TaxID=2283318 RepID=A0A345PAE2_9GAMM|nr:thioredoxin family protein [Aquirhabdus parva]AXI04251.1 thioredoxin family protein [Aquirhabdus parva]